MKTMQYNLIRRIGEVCCVAALAQTAAVADTFYPVRDKADVLSLDGTWDFELGGRRGTICVPGNWETQGWKAPKEQFWRVKKAYSAEGR